jgi:hypothetical protein
VRRLLLTASLLALAAIGPAAAQSAAAPAPDVPAGSAEAGDELTVYLMTMGPGDLVYERFGHNAIWISDARRGTEYAYNWGVFDFDQPNFLGRFVLGRMLYSMAPYDAFQTVEVYRQMDRSVWVQELNLTPAQRLALRDFLDWNALPENRDYRYDYFYDNCSTRVRDALDRVLGGELRTALGERPAGSTLRSHSRRLVSPDPVMYTLIQIGLGRPVDRPVDLWEEAFIPMRLQEQIRAVRVSDGAGGTVPLVRAEQTLHQATARSEPAAPPRWTGRFLLAGVLLGLAAAAAAWRGARARGGRVAFALLAALWGAVGGSVGAIVAFLWFFTDHAAAHRNENLLLLHPGLLALGVLLPALALGRGWGVRLGPPVALAVLALSLLALLPKALPGSQGNLEILALVIPVHAGLALGAWWLARAGVAAAPPRGAHPEAPRRGRTRKPARGRA